MLVRTLTNHNMALRLPSVLFQLKYLGPALEVLRREAGITSKTKLAKLCGLSRQQYTEYENGVTVPELPTLRNILATLRRTLTELEFAADLMADKVSAEEAIQLIREDVAKRRAEDLIQPYVQQVELILQRLDRLEAQGPRQPRER